MTPARWLLEAASKVVLGVVAFLLFWTWPAVLALLLMALAAWSGGHGLLSLGSWAARRVKGESA
jgi:hypothetical protein